MAVIEIEIPEIILENHPSLDEIKKELFENLVIDEYRQQVLTLKETLVPSFLELSKQLQKANIFLPDY